MTSAVKELDISRLSKVQRSSRAQEHHNLMCLKYADSIRESIAGTKVYTPNTMPAPKPSVWATRQRVMPYDSVSALFRSSGRKVCVLNFASFKHPGGGFMSGAYAQEESLCHKSFLYEVLDSFRDSYYMENLRYLHRCMYADRMLYTPGVIFEDDRGNTRVADVLTCSAPNISAAKGVSAEENDVWLERRVDRMFSVAEDNSVDTFIVGAWGCGVFGQNPTHVAELMHKRAKTFGGDCVLFAVPAGRNGNLQVFQKALRS